MHNELTVSGIIQNGIAIGTKNAASLVGAVFLWAITFWIPYLNVGTTIGLLGLVAKMGRGEIISPTEIFDPNYRKQMGEFFLVVTFVTMGTYIGFIFILIPGMVIAIAWSLAPLLVIDRGLNPMAAIQESNDRTYGKKWTIFLGSFAMAFVVYVGAAIVIFIFSKIWSVLGALAMLAAAVLIVSTLMGANAHIYSVLVPEEEAVAPAVSEGEPA